MTFVIERGSLAHLAIWLPLRALVNTLEALYAIVATLCGYWRPLALSAALAGAVAGCAACPALPLGLALIGLFAVVTMPRQAAR